MCWELRERDGMARQVRLRQSQRGASSVTDFYVARYSLFCRTLGQQGVTTGEKGLLKCHIPIMIIVLIIIDCRHRA